MNLSEYQTNVEKFLDKILPGAISDNDLAAAMRYSTLNAGKRLRPALVYATGEMLGCSLEQLHAPAAAIELIHCYSLIHDDLPAMDDDDLRRGKPTCHKAFSESTAILAGDALQTLAFAVLSDPELNPVAAEQRINQVNILAKAAGANGMVLGQAADMAAEQRSVPIAELNFIHQHKTGALFTACVALAQQASARQADAKLAVQLHAYAQNLGLLFQVQDDILDVIGNSEQLGKATGADQEANKSTYPSLLGLEAAQQHAQKILQNAVHALETFGETAAQLNSIANFALTRTY